MKKLITSILLLAFAVFAQAATLTTAANSPPYAGPAYITSGTTFLTSQTLTDQATVTWNVNSGQVASLTLTASRTMAAPTNLAVGSYILHVVQGGSGSYTITWNSVFKWASGIAPTLSTAVGARDIISCVSDGTNLYCGMIGDVK